MYVYRTSQFDQKARQHGLQVQVDRLCAELETQNLEQVQAHFKRLYPYLKRQANRNYRIIGKIERVGETLVLCLLYIFKRGDKDYEHFLGNRKLFGQQYLDSQLDRWQLQGWLQQQQDLAIRQPSPRPLLQAQEDLLPWLNPPGWENNTDGAIVYESREWLRRFQQPEVRSRAPSYTRAIARILSNPGDGAEMTQWSGVRLYGEDNLYVLFSRITLSDPLASKIVFLLAPFTSKPSPADIASVGRITNLFNSDRNLLVSPLRVDELTAVAGRAYPNYLLAYDNWLVAEGWGRANLALSVEEETILYSVSTATETRHSLPLFLNGRAGSGKSTMLFHLFADYCYRKFYHKPGVILPGMPLFLTYNERLLEVAKGWVNRLLAQHHRFVAERKDNAKLPDIGEFFQPFQKFLLDLLPPEEATNFTLDNYISFYRFKQEYRRCPLPKAKRYSPERCWHVIRTFIKGYGLCNLTPEEYGEEVPRKERTVLIEQFQDIYEIWQKWYYRLTAESGGWDDQDLIKKVLELRCYRSAYTAIFCDEAQDFTRIELQLIVRLSVFFQYDLGYRPIKSLPFAFAGDPFQTLNPTGFRWESFEAAFYNEAIAVLDPTGQLHLGMNFQELECNYRSCSPIVQFNNLIQLWRHLLFDLREIKPQTVWKQGYLEPQKFILDETISTEQLGGYVRDTITIVPCEEGGEVAYIRNDAVLSRIFALSDAADPPKNVLSAIAVKGLEFKRVILYKFGEACPRRIEAILNAKAEDLTVEIEYFFNKLYVAASRAIERLFIVDSRAGDNKLWDYASALEKLEIFYQKLDRPSHWKEKICYLKLGTSETAVDLREDDPQSIALAFETEGLTSENINLIRRAKRYYIDIGNVAKAESCEAWALKFEEKFGAAGNCFLKLGEFEQAGDCFWQGSCWNELMNWYAERPDKKTVERRVVEFMVADSKQWRAIANFTRVLQQFIATKKLNNYRAIAQWQTALTEYVKRIGQFLSQPLELREWQELGEVLDALSSANYPEALSRAGDCFYRAKNYERAVDCYERCRETKRQDYYLSKAMSIGLPEGLSYLEMAGESDLILGEWSRAGEPRNRSWLTHVAPVLEKKGWYQKAFIAYIILNDFPKVKSCFDRVSKGNQSVKLLKFWMKYLIHIQQWLEAIAAVETYLAEREGDTATPRTRERARLKYDLIYELAQSKLSPDQMGIGDRRRYETFIKQRILSTADWRKYLTVPQVGATLEKLGGLGLTLDFYQAFNDSNKVKPSLQNFTRERWLSTKRKQENYHRNKGEIDKAAEINLELAHKSRNWGIPLETIPAKPPIVPKERPSISLAKLPKAEAIIKGLPATTRIEQRKYGIVSFQIRHVIVRVMKATKQILIADALTHSVIRIDFLRYRARIGEVILEIPRQNQLPFSVPASAYQGAIDTRGDRPRLELTLADLSGKIVVELSETVD